MPNDTIIYSEWNIVSKHWEIPKQIVIFDHFSKQTTSRGSEAGRGLNYGKWFIFMPGLRNFDKCSWNKDKTFNCNRGTTILETDNSICVEGGGQVGLVQPHQKSINLVQTFLCLFLFQSTIPSAALSAWLPPASEVARTVTTGCCIKGQIMLRHPCHETQTWWLTYSRDRIVYPG